MFQKRRWSDGLGIPGSEIPKWFSHQNVGASLDLPMPSDLYSKLMGIAVSVVFVLHPPHPLYAFNITIIFNEVHYIRGLFQSEEEEALSHTDANGLYHLWLKFYPSSVWNEDNKSDLIKITFETRVLEVMKCGARLVYEQDIEDLKQNKPVYSSCRIAPYEADLDDLAKDTKIMQLRDDSDRDGDDAGPSGDWRRYL